LVDKKDVVARIREELEGQLRVLLQAAGAARDSATSDEARPENEYDTRALEASYLAGAQKGRAEELKALIRSYEFLPVRAYKKADPIGPAALVTLEGEAGKATYFLGLEGRPLTIKLGGKTIQVVTPSSPLGEALEGRKVGDTVEVEARGSTREYDVVGVA
jgi:transcription elongation GreA/GreB family factor